MVADNSGGGEREEKKKKQERERDNFVLVLNLFSIHFLIPKHVDREELILFDETYRITVACEF